VYGEPSMSSSHTFWPGRELRVGGDFGSIRIALREDAHHKEDDEA
jgi:hypothetical protein